MDAYMIDAIKKAMEIWIEKLPERIRHNLRWQERGNGKTPCLVWTGRTMGGYGQIWWQGRYVLVHRLIRELLIGETKQKLLHSCDNPACSNWHHAFPGSHAENMRQRCERGRTARGERHGMAKLNEREVRKLRRLRQEGWSYRELGHHFLISHQNARRIDLAELWGHVA